MTHLLDPTLFDRYLAGECSPAEAERVRDWIAEDPERRDVGEIGFARGTSATEVAWERVSRRILEVRGGLAGRVTRRGLFVGKGMRGVGSLGTQTLRRWGWVVGSCIAIVLGVLLLPSKKSESSGITRTYVTGTTQQGAVTLSDGTQIALSPNTVLRLLDFSPHSRTVVLDHGEAYFNVVQSAKSPFVVRNAGATVRVLGTAFLLRGKEDGVLTHVAVSEGRVRITGLWHPDSLTILGSGQTAEITDSTIHVNSGESLVPGAEWLHDRMFFHDTPVSVVLATLSRWYGYQFRCTDPDLTKASVTIMVSEKSSTTALATLAQILDVNLTVVGDTVTLSPQSVRRSKWAVPRTRTYDVWTPSREVGR